MEADLANGASEMKHSAIKTVSLSLLVPLALGASPAGQEYLAAPALPGFVVGYDAGNRDQSIREEVPSGETVEDWTRMVTTQRFAGVAERPSPVELVQRMARQLSAACPGASASQPVTTARRGHAAAQLRGDCPKLAQTGKPETFIVLAIAGTTDLHVKQVAFRRIPTNEDIRWSEEFLASVMPCTANEGGEGCAR